jgi:hypothetical protein
MARRKSPYPNKPYVPSKEARNRLAALMEPERREKVYERDKWQPKDGWQLWRWDTLEDVKFD